MLFAISWHVKAQNEGNFYTDKINLVNQTVDLVADYGANGNDAVDDSAALKSAIADMTALTNGGKITIPAGTFYISKVQLANNIHIVVDKDAILKPVIGKGAPMLKIGAIKNNVPELLDVIQNVSIRCAQPGQKFTVDISDANWAGKNQNFFNSQTGDNFMVSDFHVLDNYSRISCVTVNHAVYNGVGQMSKNGLVKNISGEKMAYGYGIMQMKAGTNIFFKNLSGEGGATLRLESGGSIWTAPTNLLIDQVFARDISCINGKTAAMVSPHTRDNGSATIVNVTATNCSFAAEASNGFVAADETGTPGSFASVTFTNVHGIYGSTAQVKSKHFKYVPCAIKGLISSGLGPDNESHIGPSISAVLYDADTNDSGGNEAGDYVASFNNVTDEGFLHRFELFTNHDDNFKNCNANPVNGISINLSSADLEIGETVQLSETISPSNATDPSVTWSTSDASVATVNSNGLVTAQGNGTVTITVTATDGGYPATCTVNVGSITNVTGVSVSPTSASLLVGQTIGLTETVNPNNANDKTVVWSSNNTSVATVNSNGLVTAIGDGSATITVTTNDGGFTATSTITVTSSGGGGFTEILYDDFESGFGNWNDGGSDALLYTGGTFAHQGNNAANIQDNTSTSVITTNNLALSGSNEIKVEFWYRPESMDNSNEDFWLQISTNGGASYTTVQTWARNIDFQNGQFYSESVTISGFTLTNQTRLRFRCDASGNKDDVYIDEIRVSVSGSGSTSKNTSSKEDTNVALVEDNIKTEASFKIYPNPIDDNFNVAIKMYEKSNLDINIYTINGVLVKSKKFGDYRSGTHKINLSKFDLNMANSGIYILELRANNLVKHMRVIVK
ncbi:hypothetical protein GCM10022396_40410 [Flavivirga amylovorans]